MKLNNYGALVGLGGFLNCSDPKVYGEKTQTCSDVKNITALECYSNSSSFTYKGACQKFNISLAPLAGGISFNFLYFYIHFN